MELLTIVSWLLYLVLAGLLSWGIAQMRSAIRLTVPPPPSLSHIDREMFIPFELDDIIREVAQKERQGAKEVSRQLTAFFNNEAGSTASELRHGFALFDPHRTVPTAYTPEKIRQKEDRFLLLWQKILLKANFKPLSPEELDFALSEDYLSTLPININYSQLDGELLARFNAANPVPANKPHKEHDRIWIYRRGIGIDKTTSFFFLEKANLLIQLGVQWICAKFLPKQPAPVVSSPPVLSGHRGVGRVTLADVVDFKKNGLKKSLLEKNTLQEPTFREIVLLYRRKPPPTPAPAVNAVTAHHAVGGAHAASPGSSSSVLISSSTPASSQPSTPRDENTLTRSPRGASRAPSPSSTNAPLSRSPSTSSSLSVSSHRRKDSHKEKEKEHYHHHKDSHSHKEKSSPPKISGSRSTSPPRISSSRSTSPSRSSPAHSSGSSGSRISKETTFNPLAIQIKTFVNIPMADLEIIFPEKSVRMRPLDVIKFVATGCVAVITALTNMKQDASAMLAGGLVVMLIGLASKVYLDYTSALAEYDNLLTRSLYDKSLNNNTGAVIYLVDQVAQQEAKEAVLAYCMLLNKGTCKAKKLDERVEKFLYKMSKQSSVRADIDFEVNDALGKLTSIGVVVKEEGDNYKALQPTDALAVLKARWPAMLDRIKDPRVSHHQHVK